MLDIKILRTEPDKIREALKEVLPELKASLKAKQKIE